MSLKKRPGERVDEIECASAFKMMALGLVRLVGPDVFAAHKPGIVHVAFWDFRKASPEWESMPVAIFQAAKSLDPNLADIPDEVLALADSECLMFFTCPYHVPVRPFYCMKLRNDGDKTVFGPEHSSIRKRLASSYRDPDAPDGTDRQAAPHRFDPDDIGMALEILDRNLVVSSRVSHDQDHPAFKQMLANMVAFNDARSSRRLPDDDTEAPLVFTEADLVIEPETCDARE